MLLAIEKILNIVRKVIFSKWGPRGCPLIWKHNGDMKGKKGCKAEISMLFLQKCLMGFFFNIILFICLFLAAWIFVAVKVFLQLWWAAAALWLAVLGFRLWWPRLFQSGSSRAHGLGICTHWALERQLSCGACSEACGTFLNRGSKPSFLRWQATSLPLSQQESWFDGLWRSHKKPSQGWTEPAWVVWWDVRADKKSHKEYCGIKTASELRKESVSPRNGYQVKLDFLISFLKL